MWRSRYVFVGRVGLAGYTDRDRGAIAVRAATLDIDPIELWELRPVLMFLRVGRVDHIPAPGGQLRTTAASDGRIPLADATADGLVDADRWRSTVATDLGCEFVDEIRAAGYLREIPTTCLPASTLPMPPTTAPTID